jgi:hypothetical protein
LQTINQDPAKGQTKKEEKTMANKAKNLELAIRLSAELDEVEVDLFEPESGDVTQLQFPYSPGEHPEFDEAVGQAIYWWLEQMAEGEGGVR